MGADSSGGRGSDGRHWGCGPSGEWWWITTEQAESWTLDLGSAQSLTIPSASSQLSHKRIGVLSLVSYLQWRVAVALRLCIRPMTNENAGGAVLNTTAPPRVEDWRSVSPSNQDIVPRG